MAFPTTSLLDSFPGGDEAPVTTNWTCPMFTGETGSGWELYAGRLEAMDEGGAYYDIAEYGPDVEVYCTVKNKPQFGYVSMRARIQGEGGALSSASYYEVRFTVGSQTQILKRVAGTETDLSGLVTCTYAVDDKIGMAVVGNVIYSYRYASGAWELMTSYDDTAASIPGAGYIGLYANEGTPVIDDFSGGTVVVDTTPDLLRTVRSSLRW